MRTLTFPIRGMHCASCVRLIEKVLSQIDGVGSAAVNLATEQATVSFDEKKVNWDNLKLAVSSAGYQALFSEEMMTPEAKEEQKQREIKGLKIKTAISLSVGSLLILGSFPPLSRFVPAFLKDPLIQLLLATPIQFWAGATFYQSAIRSFRHKAANMDTLVTIGTTAAYAYSVFVTLLPGKVKSLGIDPMPYFDTSVVIIALILLGRFLEAQAKKGAGEAIKKLIGLAAKTARVIRDGKEINISTNQVVIGDIIKIKPGEKIPVDGVIIEGHSTVDESMVTGESIPAEKGKGDTVIGATINKYGTFLFKANKVGADTMLSQIIRLVQQAQGSKAPIQRIADLISAYFVPVVILLAFVTFIIWYIFGPSPSLSFALLNTVAVLIIACPCAMGLATPTAIMVGTGIGAQHGILIKDAESLETAHKIKTVIFDKTGTLTTGRPEVTDIMPVNKLTEAQVLYLAASIEKSSEHALAEAIINKSRQYHLDLSPPEKFQAFPGLGVMGEVNKKEVILGNRRLMEEKNVPLTNYLLKIEKLEKEGKTVVMLAQKELPQTSYQLVGLLAIADTLKETAFEAVGKLKKLGIKVYMITGDNSQTAKAIAKQVGIESDKVFAEVLPQEKEKIVKQLKNHVANNRTTLDLAMGDASGRTHKLKSANEQIIAFVGDGINDAPALAASDVGIAMGSGTDIAIESANITLVNRDLNTLVSAIKLSQNTMRTIKLNLFWAFAYNIVLIPVAMGVLFPLFGILLNPILASLAMATSSVSVVSNSLMLKRYKL